MDDVLSVSTRPYDLRFPQVCFDEAATHVLREVQPPLPLKPGQPKRHDSHYVRAGVRNCFLLCEPLTGWRHVTVTEHRTKADFAEQIKDLVDVHSPEAERIVLVLDNLNTHPPASLYATFPPDEAKRLTEKLELHDTPKHGSWLNMAEIELSVLHRQCLDRRLSDGVELADEVAAWETERNQRDAHIDWRFTTTDARITLQWLSPSLQE